MESGLPFVEEFKELGGGGLLGFAPYFSLSWEYLNNAANS